MKPVTDNMRRLMIMDWREVVQWLDDRAVPWACTETLLQRIQRYVQAESDIPAILCVHCGDGRTREE